MKLAAVAARSDQVALASGSPGHLPHVGPGFAQVGPGLPRSVPCLPPVFPPSSPRLPPPRQTDENDMKFPSIG